MTVVHLEKTASFGDSPMAQVYQTVDNDDSTCYIGSTCEILFGRTGRHRREYKQYLLNVSSHIMPDQVI